MLNVLLFLFLFHKLSYKNQFQISICPVYIAFSLGFVGVKHLDYFLDLAGLIVTIDLFILDLLLNPLLGLGVLIKA